MINIMIVEDDKLVRKGLISLMPWADYGMKVTCEANNGEKALSLLETTTIDLVITDISMPVMTGLELMEAMQERFSHIPVVLLTLHQTFDYVQKALRLGAIDYISKVELDHDNFDDILIRIQQKLQDVRKTTTKDQQKEYFDTDEAYVWLTRKEEGELSDTAIHQVGHSPLIVREDVYMWILEKGQQDQLRQRLSELHETHPTASLCHLTGIQGKSLQEVRQALMAYSSHAFYYDFSPSRCFSDLSFDQLLASSVKDDGQEESIRSALISLQWIQDAELLDKVLHDWKTQSFPPSRVDQQVYYMVSEWNRVYSPVVEQTIHYPGSFAYWHDVKQWFYRTQNVWRTALAKPTLSEEVKACIYRAVFIVNDELSSPIHAEYVSKKVNMSRSYFSQCFKEAVGMTFNDYVRFVRIEKAKEYLANTDKPVLWVAEHTGYSDHKYFSRLFRQQVGVLPSVFRQQQREGEKNDN
ncbi:response regulator transcription factor [Aureibacillus halotolerans]|uniref:Two-component system response regulator YesN n=1 Tax=Aureibacillus halotolerans TaxID=1508390 RepID=A0A4R6U6B8_9BACI|nr:response regulator [Aureibacillus halotolerans]TDQ41132.1 two-component system response regulator YesN [Aureibacillus halotolerans]